MLFRNLYLLFCLWSGMLLSQSADTLGNTFIQLHITSKPDSAAVFLNDSLLGFTPILFRMAVTDTVLAFRYQKPGYVTETIVFKPGADTSKKRYHIFAELKVAGTIEIASEPAGAQVYLNDQLLGTTPLKNDEMYYGQYQLTLILEDYKKLRSSFLLNRHNPHFKKTFVLSPKEAELTVEGFPPDANVFLNEDFMGKLPIRNEDISFGKHSLLVIKPGFHEYSTSFDATEKRTYRFSVNLHPKNRTIALALSVLLPGAGQLYLGNNLHGSVFAIAGVGSLVGGILFNQNIRRFKEEFYEKKNAYEVNIDPTKMEELFESMKNTHSRMRLNRYLRETAFTITVTAWVLNIVDIYFFYHRMKNIAVTPAALHGNRHPGVKVSVKL